MPDETPPKPSGSPDDTNANAMPEAELDAVLAEAAALAGDLAEQIGEPPPTSVATDPLEQASAAASSITEQVEMELSELERLVEVAGTEVSESPAPDEESEASYEVPDFMSEFTDPPPAEEPSPDVAMAALDETLSAENAAVAPPVTAPPPFDPSFGVVGTETFEADPTPDMPTDLRDSGEPGLVGKILAKVLSLAGHALGGVWERLSPFACAVSERGVAVMETIDRPLTRIGGGVRCVVGWVALATTGLSLLVFAYSLL